MPTAETALIFAATQRATHTVCRSRLALADCPDRPGRFGTGWDLLTVASGLALAAALYVPYLSLACPYPSAPRL